MEQFAYNERYLTRNNRPWFPVMGEIHYSRVPENRWSERLLTMKAAGIEIASSYVIWIHHEEIEGEYDFSGNRNLRKFIEFCRDCGMFFFLRIGPWSHGEVRNGGLPDWLYEKGFTPRTNDEDYFSLVRNFYRTVYDQVNGLLIGDGGPIIGVQIENEYGHCGGLRAEAGEYHMRRLTDMAREIGWEVPYLTATGWGGAVTAGLIPVMGGYCEAPWDPRVTTIEPSGNYIFTHERNDHVIGSDYEINRTLTFDPDRFPYLTAELGGGLQVTHKRRPVATGADIGAMSLVKLGSGANLLGYYMFCGGTNPKGKLAPLHESTVWGDANDLPELSYDFRAPIRESGLIGDSYREIKRYAMFLQDFGEILCPMDAYIPEKNPLLPENTTDLRISVRRKGNSGFVFINNYQRGLKMSDHPDTRIEVFTGKDVIRYPSVDVRDGDYFFFPFHMRLGKAELISATATPLCQINGDTYVFYSNYEPRFEWADDGPVPVILTLTGAQAKNAFKVSLKKDYLIVTDGVVTTLDGAINIISGGTLEFWVYPDFPGIPEGLVREEKEGELIKYRREIASAPQPVLFEEIRRDENTARYRVRHIFRETADDYGLFVGYSGNSAKLFIEESFEADDFYTGAGWTIGMSRFGFPSESEIEVKVLREDDQIFLEKRPVFENKRVCRIESVVAYETYRTVIRL